MIKHLAIALATLVVGMQAACDDDEVCNFGIECGGGLPGQPGPSVPEGGEIRHESVRMFGQPDQAWIQVYQFKGPAAPANAPFPAPNFSTPYGNCVDERDPATASWPFKPILGATYLQIPTARITGTGILVDLDLATTQPAPQRGNLTFRTHDLAYGGGAGGDPPAGLNGTLPASAATPGGTYAIDIGQGAMTYYMPTSYEAPLGIGGADTIQIASGVELEMSWNAPPSELLDEDGNISRKYNFNFTLFADPSSEFPPQFICFPDVDGHQLIPATVIDELPAAGWIVHANQTLHMKEVDAGGETRRFDVVAAFENVSRYEKQ
jgi:hypothetical protein